MSDDLFIGNNYVDGNVELVGRYTVDNLAVVDEADFSATCSGEQSVVVATSTTEAVARAVVSHSRHDYGIDAIYPDSCVAEGLLNAVCAAAECRRIVGNDFEIVAVYAR